MKNISSCLQIVNFSSSANFTFRRWRVYRVLWCFSNRTGVCADIEWEVIIYASRQLKKHEHNYPLMIWRWQLWHLLWRYGGITCTVWLVESTPTMRAWSTSFSRETWIWDKGDEWKRWIDFDWSINYHPGKAKVVAIAWIESQQAVLLTVIQKEDW